MMNASVMLFDEKETLHQLSHYLPSQTPLKDFVHHNTLHAFQHLKFYDGLLQANRIFGYHVFLNIAEYRAHFNAGKIREDILNKVIRDKKGPENLDDWREKLLHKTYEKNQKSRVGQLRQQWKEMLKVDFNAMLHPILFRTLCSYLDQGIAIWGFPIERVGLLEALTQLERTSKSSLFRTAKYRQQFLSGDYTISSLLQQLVGDESLYSQYLFDQQFSHPGWSGMVAAIESQASTLLAKRPVTLHDLIIFESFLELDTLEYHSKKEWKPLVDILEERPAALFDPLHFSELDEVCHIWQEAYEWSYYDQVIAGIQTNLKDLKNTPQTKSFQALFCIDDRECSIRRHVEKAEPNAETFGTPGFFGVPFYYQPKGSIHYTKLSPGGIQPKHLIKELNSPVNALEKDIHFNKYSHNFHSGWLMAQTVGFWSAVRLVDNIFRPSMAPLASSSLNHMHKFADLTIENKNPDDKENGLQIGFTIDEMAECVQNVLLSIGLVKDFAPLVYVIGHGASSINNPHYAAYDCGACSGRAGSVNARIFSFMANKKEVREILAKRGISIPENVQFIGALHDTTRDDMVFYDEDTLHEQNAKNHKRYVQCFEEALNFNAKERSRKFESINTKKSPEHVHKRIRARSVSLFEPRPELNHATNALTIIGNREITKNIFLDRRSFLNSYDYRIDPDGKYLLSILRAATPVSGGINLEYYFSRVDNDKLGASSKLPHNVMGLIGVANGTDGDLRPGLPSQMIEVHDPIRMFFVIEQHPEVVLQTIQSDPKIYEWYQNEWVYLAVLAPGNRQFYVFKDQAFIPYLPLTQQVEKAKDLNSLIENSQDTLPVLLLQ